MNRHQLNTSKKNQADDQLLADENDSVLSVLGPALHRLLRLTPTSSDGINPHRFHATRTTPVLKLHLYPRSDRRQMGDIERFEALSAFALLVTHLSSSKSEEIMSCPVIWKDEATSSTVWQARSEPKMRGSQT
ncbi:hypothetical protein P3T76_011218 [Phytophthora citrophthora]|uniref:Uncharacterized protein n=1 Tax=Phytophthora citrophthora TaxID=4793 RepID=A0AAD9GA51_9STRA|nr:hypothetical protein P3T76_011218 [Phytophthora citrophthora]